MEEIHTIVKKFGEGAYNAKRAGFDGVQIHAARRAANIMYGIWDVFEVASHI